MPGDGPIVLCFGVVDEADIIEDFIEYHLGLGVDRFVATDVGSTDGTLDVLSRYERTGRLDLTRFDNPSVRAEQRDWLSTMAHTARDRYSASWCLFCDPDEFWIFPDGDAPGYFATAAAPIAIFPRCNVVPSRRPGADAIADFREFDLVTRRPLEFFYDLGVLNEPDGIEVLLNSQPPDIIRVVAPKVAAAADVIQAVKPGFHDVVATSPSVTRHHETCGYVAHLPVRSPVQFYRKAELVARYIAANPPEIDRFSSRHWVRLSAIFNAGLIDSEFARQVLSDEEVKARLREGVLERDSTLTVGFAKGRRAAVWG